MTPFKMMIDKFKLIRLFYSDQARQLGLGLYELKSAFVLGVVVIFLEDLLDEVDFILFLILVVFAEEVLDLALLGQQ